MARSAVPGAGLHCQDVLNGGELFLMDLAMSQSVPNDNAALATRTIPLGEYWMTGGAGLPISSKKSILDALRRMESEQYKPLEGPGGVALPVARACLAAGAAEYHLREFGSKPEEASAAAPLARLQTAPPLTADAEKVQNSSLDVLSLRRSRAVLLNLRFFAGHDDSLMPPSGVDSVD